MTTLPHLTRQPHSRWAQRQRRRRRLLLAVVPVAALTNGAYLVHWRNTRVIKNKQNHFPNLEAIRIG